MTILILNSSMIYGGGEYFTLTLLKELNKRGFKAVAGCNPGGKLIEKCKAYGIITEAVDFPEKGAGNLGRNIKKIRGLITKYNAGIVHTNTGYDRTAGAFAVRKTNARHVTSCHSLESIRHNLTHYIRNRYLTDHFICDGESIRDLIVRENSFAGNKSTVVHNGINPEEMKRDETARAKLRKEYGISPDEIVIGNTGRMVEFKGQKYLLNAYRIILTDYPKTRLIITGDGELMNELKAQAETLGIAGNVIFTGFREDLREIYSVFDIYAHSSVEGGGELFPFSVLYALAQKLPVVSSKAGDIPVIIEDSVNGYIVEDKSPYRLYEKLSGLINDSELRKIMGEKGYERLINRFTLEKTIDKILNIYSKVK